MLETTRQSAQLQLCQRAHDETALRARLAAEQHVAREAQQEAERLSALAAKADLSAEEARKESSRLESTNALLERELRRTRIAMAGGTRSLAAVALQQCGITLGSPTRPAASADASAALEKSDVPYMAAELKGDVPYMAAELSSPQQNIRMMTSTGMATPVRSTPSKHGAAGESAASAEEVGAARSARQPGTASKSAGVKSAVKSGAKSGRAPLSGVANRVALVGLTGRGPSAVSTPASKTKEVSYVLDQVARLEAAIADKENELSSVCSPEDYAAVARMTTV